jgi:hypothetical protein
MRIPAMSLKETGIDPVDSNHSNLLYCHDHTIQVIKKHNINDEFQRTNYFLPYYFVTITM